MSNLFLTNVSMTADTPSGAEVTRHKLASAAGATSTLRNKNTVAAPASPLKLTDSATAGIDGNTIAWYSDPLQAVTIAGQIVASLWGRESANTANTAPTIGIYRCSAAGAELATIIDPALNLAGAEFATTAGGATKTITIVAANVPDTAIADGERLKAALFIDNAVDQGGAGSMATGNNAQFWVNGPTGSAGQSQIAFAETILGVGDVLAAPRRIIIQNKHAVARAGRW